MWVSKRHTCVNKETCSKYKAIHIEQKLSAIVTGAMKVTKRRVNGRNCDNVITSVDLLVLFLPNGKR